MQAWIERWIDEMRAARSTPERDEILFRPLKRREEAPLVDIDAARDDLKDQMRALADLALHQ